MSGITQAPTKTKMGRVKKPVMSAVGLQTGCGSGEFRLLYMHMKCGGPISSLHLAGCPAHSRFSIQSVDHFRPPTRPENVETLNTNLLAKSGPFSRLVFNFPNIAPKAIGVLTL